MKPRLLDANLIIRLLTNDDEKKARAVEKLFSNQKQAFLLLDLTLAEVVWTLISYYKIPKKIVCEKLRELLLLSNIKSDRGVLMLSLEIYQTKKIDYTDAYLAAKALSQKLIIYSYDRDFDKVAGVKRKRP